MIGIHCEVKRKNNMLEILLSWPKMDCCGEGVSSERIYCETSSGRGLKKHNLSLWNFVTKELIL